MNCELDHELLSMYADGALNRELLSHVETHISKCEVCRRAVEDIRIIGEALGSLPREAASSELIERIIAESERTTRRTAWDSIKCTISAVWTVGMNGFKIEDDRERSLRRELPVWVARWVLFV